MGRKKSANPKEAQRYRPEKVSIGVELVALPDPMPNVARNKVAYQVYQYIGAELIASSKLATTDIFALQRYALMIAAYFDIEEKLKGEWVVPGQRGKEKVVNRLFVVWKQINGECGKLEKQLGCTPYTRGLVNKVTTVNKNPTPQDPTRKPEFEDLNLD